jgi:Flp pilus assembly pilin Flp
MKGSRRAIAIVIVGLLGVVPPVSLLADETPIGIDIPITIGPFAARLKITPPVAISGSTVVYQSELQVDVHDGSQTPRFDGYLVATGQAADPDDLVGALPAAAICVQQDLLAGMTFQQAAADCQAKTGVTVTSLEDPTAVEYAVMLALIIVVDITLARTVAGSDLDIHLTKFQDKASASLVAIGITPPCTTNATTQ